MLTGWLYKILLNSVILSNFVSSELISKSKQIGDMGYFRGAGRVTDTSAAVEIISSVGVDFGHMSAMCATLTTALLAKLMTSGVWTISEFSLYFGVTWKTKFQGPSFRIAFSRGKAVVR